VQGGNFYGLHRDNFRFFVIVAVVAERYAAAKSAPNTSKRFTENFNLSSCNWSSTGRNDFFILEPGYQQVFEGHEGSDVVRLEITVLSETRKVAGVETRVIEEKESRNGVPIEIGEHPVTAFPTDAVEE